MNKQLYKKFKKMVEEKLRAYPYYLISLENEDNPDKEAAVKIINLILERLDKQSARIIEASYFKDIDKEEVMKELKIDINIFYRKKRKAIEKFIMGLGYL